MKIYHYTFIAINLIGAFDCIICFDGFNYFDNTSRPGYIFGDYIVGALLPIHDKTNGSHFDYDTCHFITDNGIQIAEAALFAIDLINKNGTILPDNVTLGIHIIDYCGRSDRAEAQIEKLVSGTKNNKTQSVCSSPQKDIGSPFIGLIGPEGHSIFEEVADVLHVFGIIQLFYFEPFLEVTNKKIYRPYLFSVIPEKKFMTEAIFDILTNNNWTYILFIYDDELLGELDVQMFHQFAFNVSVCIAEDIRLSFQYDIKNELSKYIEHVAPWLDKVDAIVCHCSSYVINLIFSMIQLTPDKRTVVIGGDGWFPRQPPELDHPDLQLDEIILSMKKFHIKEFDDHFLNLSVENNTRNPWFTEFWQDHFKCKVDFSNSSEYRNNCSGNETLIRGYKQNPKVPYVIKSVFVLAYALRNTLTKYLDKPKSNFEQFRFHFMMEIATVKFDFYGESFEFDFNSGVTTVKQFNIHNLQISKNNTYDYVKIGEYVRKNNELSEPHNFTMNNTLIYPGYKAISKFYCHASCSSIQAKALKEKPCCYECKNCDSLDILVGNFTRCEKCKDFGFMPDSSKANCVEMPTKGTQWHDAPILGSLLFSSFDITLTIFTFYVFIKNQHTPVVKSSTKELCCTMLVGMISANLLSFMSLLTPNYFICAIVRILPPISFTLIYAALLVKTNRIARILAISKKKFPKLNPKFLSLRAQIVFTILLIGAEASICLCSFFHYPIKIVDIVREKNGKYHKVKMCSIGEGVLIETFVFIGGLILICTYYAVKTRNLPENFNEAKYIGFAMYATILTDISFGLIYFETNFKIFTINLFISANTLIAFIFLFAPKLYVILCTPEKNTRANFITSKKIRCSFTNHRESSERNRAIK